MTGRCNSKWYIHECLVHDKNGKNSINTNDSSCRLYQNSIQVVIAITNEDAQFLVFGVFLACEEKIF